MSGRPGRRGYAPKAAVMVTSKILATELASERINVNNTALGLIVPYGGTSVVSAEDLDAIVGGPTDPWGRITRLADVAQTRSS